MAIALEVHFRNIEQINIRLIKNLTKLNDLYKLNALELAI